MIGLPKSSYSSEKVCSACAQGNMTKTSFKSKNIMSTTQALQLLHLDLFRPTRTSSLRSKRYDFVIIDDYSRFTWVLFLTHKSEALFEFIHFCKRIQTEKGYLLNFIRNDHDQEFENLELKNFCNKNRITHNFSSPKIS